MANVEEHRPLQTRVALLIVDAQVGLVELMPAEVERSVLPRIKTLLAKARASGTPVIYIQHDGPKGASAGDPYERLGNSPVFRS